MIPPIQGDGGRLRLEWTCARSLTDPCWEAYVGIFTLRVRDRITHSQWDIDIRGICGDLHNAESVLAGQLAAEAALRDLLCSALAAFAEAETRNFASGFSVIRDRYATLPDLFLVQDNRRRGHPFFAMTAEEMRTLAIALLSASQAGGGK